MFESQLMIPLIIYVMLVCAVVEHYQEQSVSFNVLILAYLYRVLLSMKCSHAEVYL